MTKLVYSQKQQQNPVVCFCCHTKSPVLLTCIEVSMTKMAHRSSKTSTFSLQHCMCLLMCKSHCYGLPNEPIQGVLAVAGLPVSTWTSCLHIGSRLQSGEWHWHTIGCSM